MQAQGKGISEAILWDGEKTEFTHSAVVQPGMNMLQPCMHSSFSVESTETQRGHKKAQGVQ